MPDDHLPYLPTGAGPRVRLPRPRRHRHGRTSTRAVEQKKFTGMVVWIHASISDFSLVDAHAVKTGLDRGKSKGTKASAPVRFLT